MKNEYEIRGDVTAIFIDSLKYGRFETLVSTRHLEKLMSYPAVWTVIYNPHMKQFYCKWFPNKKSNTKSVFLHRFITDAPKGMVVDHINHDTLDNRDENLRIISHCENLQNRKGAQSDSRTGIRGVGWLKSKNRWRARIKINGKSIFIGSFSDIGEAEAAVKEARKKYMPFSNN